MDLDHQPIYGLRTVTAPLPYGAALTAAGKIGIALYQARQEDIEISKIIRQALRTSICRYDPYAPCVDTLAERIEAAMWEVAKESIADGPKGWLGKLRAGIPKLGRSAPSTMDFPDWQRELASWVEAAALRIPLESYEGQIPCRSFPNVSVLTERFPVMFQLELFSRRRRSNYRLSLLARLKQSTGFRETLIDEHGAAWMTGLGAAIAAAVGLGVGEIANWSDPGLIAAAGGSVGAAVGRVLAQQQKPTEQQRRVRAFAAMWIREYLQLRTGSPIDEAPRLMLEEAIELESAGRNRRADVDKCDFDMADQDLTGRIDDLGNQLKGHLIPEADAAGEGNVADAMRHLAAALDRRSAGGEEDDSLFHAIHVVMVALDIAPARRILNHDISSEGAGS